MRGKREGEEVVEYNRLISEQNAPAERKTESRKDRRGSRKEKMLRKKGRMEIKHAFSSLKGLRWFWGVSVLSLCVCVHVCVDAFAIVTLLLADTFLSSASEPDR